MRIERWVVRGLLCAALGGPCLADEIVLNNGDRLSGTILEADEGKIRIKTDAVGEVSVDLAQVQTFTTDAPVTLKLEDGTVLRQRIGPAEAAGAIQLLESGQTLDIAQIDKVNPPPVVWTGSVVAGGMLTRGNSDSASFSLLFDATRRAEQNRTTVNAGYFFAEQEDDDTGESQATTDNWFVSGKYDYFLNEKLYLFGLMRVERDRIADLDLRLAPSAGLGYQWVETSDFNFNTEAGLGWVYEEYDNGDTEEHVAARLAYHIDKQINDRVELFHNLTYLPSFEELSDFNINADAGIRADFTDNLFGELRVEWRHDATPAPGSVENDLRYVLGAGWEF